MALTTNQIATDYPLPAYNYRVDIGSDTIAFSEVSGLEIKIDTIVYSESPKVSGKQGRYGWLCRASRTLSPLY